MQEPQDMQNSFWRTAEEERRGHSSLRQEKGGESRQWKGRP